MLARNKLIIESLMQSCKEVKLMREGKMKKKTWDEFKAEIDETENEDMYNTGMATKISPTPALVGRQAREVFESLHKKPSQNSLRGAKILQSKFEKLGVKNDDI